MRRGDRGDREEKNNGSRIKGDTEKVEHSNLDTRDVFMGGFIAILIAIIVAVSHEEIILPFLDPALGMLAIQRRSPVLSFSLLIGTPFIISSILFYIYSRDVPKSFLVGFFTVIVWFFYSVLTWRVI